MRSFARSAAFDRAVVWALGRSPLAVGVWVIAIAALFAGLAALAFSVGGPFLLFQPDGEGKPPAAFSASVLGAAGVLALVGPVPDERRTWAWRGIGGFLAWMALDEALVMHERFQTMTGVSWQMLYAPLILAGGILWLAVGSGLRRERLALWGVGASLWAAAQVLEILAWNSDGTHNGGWQLMSTVEEACETMGSGAWLVTILLVMGGGVAARG